MILEWEEVFGGLSPPSYLCQCSQSRRGDETSAFVFFERLQNLFKNFVKYGLVTEMASEAAGVVNIIPANCSSFPLKTIRLCDFLCQEKDLVPIGGFAFGVLC